MPTLPARRLLQHNPVPPGNHLGDEQTQDRFRRETTIGELVTRSATITTALAGQCRLTGYFSLEGQTTTGLEMSSIAGLHFAFAVINWQLLPWKDSFGQMIVKLNFITCSERKFVGISTGWARKIAILVILDLFEQVTSLQSLKNGVWSGKKGDGK